MSVSRHTPKPSRPYQRFKATAKVHSGVDHNGAFLSFIKNDPKTNYNASSYQKLYKVELDTLKTEQPAGLVPVGTTKCTYGIGLKSKDAKIDRCLLGMTT